MKLSKRQAQIAGLIADGRSGPEIAGALGIELGSVRTHIVRIKRKKGLSSMGEISQYVWKKRASRIYKGIQASP